MKQETIKTKSPKLILQVYHNYFLYHKDIKSFSDRKELTKWKSAINSKSGYLKDGKLILSKADYTPDILNSDLIILNDFNSETETNGQIWTSLKQTQYFTLIGSARKFEIFQLKRIGDEVELHLRYDLYKIGEPKRDNFKLCTLKINTPIEIKINGKLDHSLSNRRERSYKEHCYIFHLIGKTDEFEFINEPFDGSIKKIPKPLKVLDLMKKLY